MSLSEQKRLVDFLDERLIGFGRIQEILNNQINTLPAYRKSLIHECVTGQRRVTEADVARIEKQAPDEWRMN